jgi:DNA-directed RNA polymerase subunit RPC12/RpoP
MSESFAPAWAGKPVTCPYCGSQQTEIFSLFGQQLLTLQYYCRTCHTPFEYVKDEQPPDEGEASRHAGQSLSRSSQ